MLFLDKSTRTRNAFESGMTQLGGHAIYLDAEKTQVAHGESPKDMGVILSRYGHGLAIRHDLAPYEGNAWMREIARWADIPLINLQCDVDHPTQTLADLMTLRERRRRRPEGAAGGGLVGLCPLVREAALGAAGPRDAAAPLRHRRRRRASARLGADARGERARRDGRGGGGGSLSFVHDMEEAFEGADVVYPKSWGRLDAFADEADCAGRVRASTGTGSATRGAWPSRARTPSTCTACPPTAARGDGRGDRRTAVGRLRRGREPDAHRQGPPRADDGRLRVMTRRRIVVALGGNALLRRGEQLSADVQRGHAGDAMAAVAELASTHEVVLTHGNGPQVGLLALQSLAYTDVPPYPLDVLGAEGKGSRSATCWSRSSATGCPGGRR